ncbi:MAG TPA: signal peptidase I [Solirubrobacteraceae bacterium]|nr:signal peptidase I [Solirubrobacteraceae bacterium]
MRTRPIRWLISGVIGLFVAGCAWYCLAPTSLGGSATYVVTHGVSMEPRFHTGDLAIVRSQSHYRVGEIAAYRNKMLGTVVLHRIVGREGDRYLFKGDNNHFVDFEHPLGNQLIGALWLHLPGAGADLHSIRSPALVGLLALAGALLLFGGAFVRRRGRARRQRRSQTQTPGAPPRDARGGLEPLLGAFSVGLLALLPFVALALLAFTRAPTARTAFRVPYTQSGSFSYSAPAPPGPAYPSGRASTGDPLFLHVLKAVHVRFDYRFQTAAKHSLRGKAWMAATISSTSGWHTTLPLGAPTFFSGDHARFAATLDLGSLLALIHGVQSATDVNGAYTLTLTPTVRVNGSVELQPLSSTFAPAMEFSMSELEAKPLAKSAALAPAAGSRAGDSRFKPSAPGSVGGKRYEPTFLSLGFTRMRTASARTLALAGIALVLCALAAAVALLRRRPRSAGADIEARYGRLIVPVERVWQLPGVPVIDVADADALASIAEHYDRSILHERNGGTDSFWVSDESGQFRYAHAANGRRRAPANAQPQPQALATTPSQPDPLLALSEQDTPPSWPALSLEQPPLEQAPYEEPAYEQPRYEQAPYEQPAYEQRPYEQPGAVPAAEPALMPQPAAEPALEPALTPQLAADLAAFEQASEVSVTPSAEAAPAAAFDIAEEVYADELELGGLHAGAGEQNGTVAATGWTAPDPAPEPAHQAQAQPEERGWATPEQLPETFVLETARGENGAAPAQPPRVPAALAFARFAGLEWTTES